MARYYFDINDNGLSVPDDEGVECGNLAAVREAAIDALPRMACDAVPAGDHHVISISVRDQADKPVFQASLTIDAGLAAVGRRLNDKSRRPSNGTAAVESRRGAVD
ncbi:hypothetical protein GTW51_19170 [Aurantimonas aggregata]|uniref:DUF6894 domain-containing protein n=1 Tax=Aurantimonas aggregata TaxID=2047720 RepID=A0A6L9MLU3_9HYPH|nr:hypothetical protein [Aurantimonas aggregata]NDV88819.1 hypothetical protein [Aurantimonas aggregata]